MILKFLFTLGYSFIAFEEKSRVDKLIPAVIMMTLMWAVVAVTGMPVYEIFEGLVPSNLHDVFSHHTGKTSEIIIFLMGAMTIVESISYFNGFAAIKQFITTTDKRKLLWIITILAFGLSAVIDNLTATIVLIQILHKLLAHRTDKIWLGSMIVLAANAGGAWSPIGDVTTTMLWVGKKVTVEGLIQSLLPASIVCMLVSNFFALRLSAFKGEFEVAKSSDDEKPADLSMLIIGLAAIVSVPVFKTVTHLSPYVGMLGAMGVVLAIAEYKTQRAIRTSDIMGEHNHSAVHSILTGLEIPSLLFFIGILMSVAALESVGAIFHAGEAVLANMPVEWFVVLLGFGSAIIDNVPLVAASMGMFQFPEGHDVWNFIAYTAGVGGSMLIIGSAAGVIAMGLLKIEFVWYLKNIAPIALKGYLAGVLVFALMHKEVLASLVSVFGW